GEMKTYVHEPDCEVTEQVQSWEESGSTITVEYMGYNITGEVSGSTGNQMIIESDISEYAELINIYYPGIPIPEGSKMKLYLNKLNNSIIYYGISNSFINLLTDYIFQFIFRS